MKIKYLGQKPQKVIEYNDKRFVFAPDCEVNDAETIKFLLHIDRKGLFEEVREKVPEAPKVQPEPSQAAKKPIVEVEAKPKKKKGRPKKE